MGQAHADESMLDESEGKQSGGIKPPSEKHMPIVYKTVTFALNIDLTEEGLDSDAKDSEIIAAAEAYSDDSWEEVSEDIFVEAIEAGPRSTANDDDGEDFDSEEDEEDPWADDDGEFVFDEEADELPEFPSEEEDY